MPKEFFEKCRYDGGLFFDLSKWIIVVVVALMIINNFWFTIFVVDGSSMEPNLHDGEVVLLDKTFVRSSAKPQRGEAVVIKYPGDPEQKRYVKRVIGLPGEFVQIEQSKIYINNKQLKESYIPIGYSTYPDGRWSLKKGEYFLMGDNRENSNDSRYFGAVEERFFIGKATSVILPSPREMYLPNYNLTLASDSKESKNAD